MRYVTVRTLAESKGFAWGMIGEFKGDSFMSIERGVTGFTSPVNSWNEKDVRDTNGVDIRSYDPEINFVEDNTIIDGCFEDSKYWGHNLDNIREWLQVEPLAVPDGVHHNLCIIGFRGGEFYTDPDLGLPQEYWNSAIRMMRAKYGYLRFEVHTDDPVLAKKFFPEFECIHDIGLNWRSIRYAHHLIIANSAFYIMPALLNQNAQEIIAPRYWARRNTGVWARPSSYYPRFTYI